ncbi:MAG: DNA polymerase IV [Candidatus Omnitrophica bacterium]|nr:DNA polymerase IV [Candidatus Omnitrophota bacterium]
MPGQKFIGHVDMDAFFASIEQRDGPSYRNKPVVVGADPKGGKGRGVVSTCSYEARRYGIHSAMPISVAYARCPHAVFLPVDMEKYESVSRQVYQILNDFTPDIETIGIDEAFFDITGSFHLFGSPADTCIMIKTRIRQETGLTASIGLAPIKMAAKIASDMRKPDGFVEVSREGLLDFLWPLDIGKMWGVGAKTLPLLHEMGIKTIGDLARRQPSELSGRFGASGAHFWQLANGIDDRNIEPGHEAQSVSNEITFDTDTSDKELLAGTLMYLSEKVSARLREDRLTGRTIMLKVRLKGFTTYTRAVTIPEATNYADSIYYKVTELWNRFYLHGSKIRLVGVRVSNLCRQDETGLLFEDSGEHVQERIHGALDSIRQKFGEGLVYRARSRRDTPSRGGV